VAQSAVSQTIQALESEVGAELFVRSRRVALTPAGAEFGASARRAIEELDRGAAMARRVSSGEEGRLSVSFGPLVALAAITRVVARFQQSLPRVALDLQAYSSAEQLESLRQGKTDVAILQAAKHDLGGLAHAVVERAPIAAFLPAEHRFAKRRSIAFGDLSGERLLVLEETRDPRVRSQILAECRAHGFEPSEVVGIPQLEALLAFVAARLGISFAPAIVGRARFPRVVSVPVRPRITAEILAVWDPARLPATGRRLIELAAPARSP
jgi:DNA-binding transcriptional LysR family regulator